ncbi:MAG TPA: hypothetical protein VN608_00010 [Clostridia bacterium]|nr:hypothetical protein [Clostridia bacterium]
MEDHLENDICDLDSNKICDNCCKCLEQPDEPIDDSGYRVIAAKFRAEDTEEYGVEHEQESAIAALFQEEENDTEEYNEIDPFDIPPALMAEWEAKLAASFRKDEEGETSSQTKLKGSRKRCD